MKIEVFTPTAKNNKSLDELDIGDDIWIIINGVKHKLKVKNRVQYQGKNFHIICE